MRLREVNVSIIQDYNFISPRKVDQGATIQQQASWRIQAKDCRADGAVRREQPNNLVAELTHSNAQG